MKLLEVQSTKDFASTFLNDIFFKMAVNRVLDAAPGFELVRCKDCKHYVKSKECSGGMCREHTVWMDTNDFCNYGERKEDGQA